MRIYTLVISIVLVVLPLNQYSKKFPKKSTVQVPSYSQMERPSLMSLAYSKLPLGQNVRIRRSVLINAKRRESVGRWRKYRRSDIDSTESGKSTDLHLGNIGPGTDSYYHKRMAVVQLSRRTLSATCCFSDDDQFRNHAYLLSISTISMIQTVSAGRLEKDCRTYPKFLSCADMFE